VDAVRAAGGLSVLAHSGQQQNFDLIPASWGHGLNGLETQPPYQQRRGQGASPEIRRALRVFLTGGSDYHGTYDSRFSRSEIIYPKKAG
jgi:predicted metal-dependent phosphoesterase TrpH